MPSGLGGMMGGLSNPGMMGLGAAAGAYATMQAFAGQAKEMEHAAARMGVGVEQYQELERAARKSGLSIDETAGGLRKMQTAIFGAMKGGKDLTNTFHALGIDTRKLAHLDAAGQLEEVAKGLAKIQNTTVRRGLETEIFGREGANMDPMLHADRPRRLEEVFQRVGLDRYGRANSGRTKKRNHEGRAARGHEGRGVGRENL